MICGHDRVDKYTIRKLLCSFIIELSRQDISMSYCIFIAYYLSNVAIPRHY